MNETKFIFSDIGKTLFTIKADGTIERGEDFTTNDEMSLKFWEAVESNRRSLVEISPEITDKIAELNILLLRTRALLFASIASFLLLTLIARIT